MGTLKTTNIEPIADNGTVTLGSSGDTFALAAGVTQTIAVNTPAFEAYGSAEQTGVADNVFTKLVMNTELYDTGSMYDTATYRFTPTTAGKYWVYGQLSLYSETSYNLQVSNISIYKNGSNYKYQANNEGHATPYANERGLSIGAAVDFNGSSDYVELYARANVISGTVGFEVQSQLGLFGAYKILT